MARAPCVEILDTDDHIGSALETEKRPGFSYIYSGCFRNVTSSGRFPHAGQRIRQICPKNVPGVWLNNRASVIRPDGFSLPF
jgi:hypothetical protein